MMGVFAEFERAIIRERVRSGLERAKAQGKVLGRRRNDDPKRLASVRRLRKKGVGIGKIARTLGIGASYVQRVVAETEPKRSAIEHWSKPQSHRKRMRGARWGGFGDALFLFD